MELETIRALVSGHESELILPERTRYTAVLMPLVEKDGQLHVLFEVRSAGIAQGGEVSFPGGHVEPGETPAQAALRETCEELRLRPEQVEILAPLHKMTDRGRLVIDSFLGVLHGYEGSRSASEVAQVFTVPLEELLSMEPQISAGEMVVKTGEDFPFELIPGGRSYPFFRYPKRFFFYRTDQAVIWGLTAELLYHALELLRQGPQR